MRDRVVVAAPFTTSMVDVASLAVQTQIDAGNLDAAIKSAADLIERVSSPDRARVLVLSARALRVQGDILNCLRVAADAANLAQTHGDIDSEIEAYLEAGHVLQSADDSARAISYYESAERLVEQTDSDGLAARVLQGFGISAAKLDRYDEAVAYLERSAATLQTLGETHDWFSARVSLLCAHSQAAESAKVDPAERQEKFRSLLGRWEALAIEAEHAGAPVISMLARNNYARALRFAGDFTAALNSQAALRARAEDLKRRPSLAIIELEMGLSLAALNRHKDALRAFKRALDYFAGGSKYGERETYVGISETHEALGDFAASLAALKKVRQIDASIDDQKAHSAITKRELAASLQMASARWERLAKEDTLTGLANRRAFEQWMSAAMARVNLAYPISIMMVDIDHFKAVNDTYGHAVGDLALKNIGELMQHNCRYGDLPARFGGEEFILALPHTDEPIGVDVAERLRAAVERFDWGSIQPGLRITISIGVAAFKGIANDVADTTKLLLEEADRQLYLAKAAGRNRVCSGLST